MKKIISLIALVFLFSFSKTVEKLENGTYKVELDKKYKEIGMNDYEFTLENEKFFYRLNDVKETFLIKWIDESSFIVEGLTGPMNPNKLEKKMMEEAFFFFKITKHDGNVYYFTLGEDKDEYPIYTGKFIKK